MATVSSLLPPSTTIRSSQNFKLSIQSAILAASLPVIVIELSVGISVSYRTNWLRCRIDEVETKLHRRGVRAVHSLGSFGLSSRFERPAEALTPVVPSTDHGCRATEFPEPPSRKLPPTPTIKPALALAPT